MIIINNKFLPFGKNYLAINIFGVVFTKGPLSKSIIRHESIHTYQQLELLFIFFYLIYIIEWLIRLVMCRNSYKAYKNISFEREAYDNMYKINYLKARKWYSWIKYIKE